jgi:hypothetical protein
MTNTSGLDLLPLWLLLAFTLALLVLAVEAGYRLGIVRARSSAHEREASIDALVGATMGLLAFILAFTFSAATSRHDTRKQLVLDEANAIRTADLRAQVLPEPHRSDVRALLREYVDVRVQGTRDVTQLQQAIKRSEELPVVLWARAASLGQEVRIQDRSAFQAALIDIITLHTKRLTAAIHNRLHAPIWYALYCLAILAMALLGYRAGISGRRSIVAVMTTVLAFSTVIVLIADIDRPQQGIVTVSQQAMLDLQDKLRAPTSVGTP